jgi:hypothetical protein
MKKRECGYTLAEVLVSTAVSCLVFGGIVSGYVKITDHAEWSAYSLAAQSLASQAVEQVRAAKWDPNAWPPVDELGLTEFAKAEEVNVPLSPGQSVWATNYVSVSVASLAPPLRELRADCVWVLPSRGSTTRGPFTNSVITLRCPDQ